MTPIQQAIAILEEDALTNRIERALEVLRASQEDAPPPYFKYAQDISDRGGQPQSPADALRVACGAVNGCSCADMNYQWYGPHCEATMTSVFRTMLADTRPLRGGK